MHETNFPTLSPDQEIAESSFTLSTLTPFLASEAFKNYHIKHSKSLKEMNTGVGRLEGKACIVTGAAGYRTPFVVF